MLNILPNYLKQNKKIRDLSSEVNAAKLLTADKTIAQGAMVADNQLFKNNFSYSVYNCAFLLDADSK